MHALVCIKQVPDTQELQVDFDAGVIKREGVPLIINPFDEFAIEEAVCLKEKHGGSVTALTMGPSSADEALRTALAMGCDAAVHLLDEAFEGGDTWATATVLAKALEKVGSRRASPPCSSFLCSTSSRRSPRSISTGKR
jgi:electron transfer flavoprotein beta subunit